jgi:hypothetical protein
MFINLTPHDIVVAGHGNIPASGQVARVVTNRTCVGTIGGLRLTSQTFGEVQGLPDPQSDMFFIVSSLVLAALSGSRRDVVAPDTGADALRENGQIIAVRGFVQ